MKAADASNEGWERAMWWARRQAKSRGVRMRVYSVQIFNGSEWAYLVDLAKVGRR